MSKESSEFPTIDDRIFIAILRALKDNLFPGCQLPNAVLVGRIPKINGWLVKRSRATDDGWAEIPEHKVLTKLWAMEMDSAKACFQAHAQTGRQSREEVAEEWSKLSFCEQVRWLGKSMNVAPLVGDFRDDEMERIEFQRGAFRQITPGRILGDFRLERKVGSGSQWLVQSLLEPDLIPSRTSEATIVRLAVGEVFRAAASDYRESSVRSGELRSWDWLPTADRIRYAMRIMRSDVQKLDSVPSTASGRPAF